MHSLAFPFKILSVCGIWQPLHWQDQRHLRYLYKLYSAITITCFNVIMLLQGALLFLNEFDVSFAVDVLFIMLCVVSIATKALNFLVRRDRVIGLANMLMKSCCLPRSAAEIQMEKDSDEFLRVFTIYFNALAQAAVFLLAAVPLVQEPDERELPYPMWLPYDIHDDFNYWITYSIVVGGSVIGVLINVTVDVVVSGFVLKACMQLDILRHRLNQFTDIVRRLQKRGAASREAVMSFERTTLRQTVLHHDYIIKFAGLVAETFDVMIVEQFFAGALVFSIIVYMLTMGKVPLIKKFMAFVYLICMMGELFAYCWFGNEITIKSFEFSTDVYNTDWTALSQKTKKMLIIIMMRMNKPIIMSYGHLISLNIDSFKSILKVTYTAFNVLKESS